MKIEDYLKDNERLKKLLELKKDVAVSRMRERVKHIRSPLSFKEPPERSKEPGKRLEKLTKPITEIISDNRATVIKLSVFLAVSSLLTWIGLRLKRFLGRSVTSEENEVEKEEVKVERMAARTYTDSMNSKMQFARDAYEGYLALGLSSETAKQMAAQDALETNWGAKQSGKFNFGGIKWTGKGEEGKDFEWIRTTEQVSDEVVKTNVKNGVWRNPVKGKNKAGKTIWYVDAKFRNFSSYAEYSQYKWDMLTSKNYGISLEDSAEDIRKKLVKGGYATDAEYSKKLAQMMKTEEKFLVKGEELGITLENPVAETVVKDTVITGPNTVNVIEYETSIGSDSGPKATTL